MNNELLEIITDDQINDVWGSADFGNVSRRDIIKDALLQIAGDFSTGSTATAILKELSLINASGKGLTKKGRRYLFYAFRPKAVPDSPPALLEVDAEKITRDQVKQVVYQTICGTAYGGVEGHKECIDGIMQLISTNTSGTQQS